ncbi:MAG TPA: rod shape-determining protein MreC [Treponema sp.]|nr:rod shape-determining protein MreC [Treponema sp.]
MKSPFSFKLPEITLAFLLIVSGIGLAFSSGGFIVDFNAIGFTVMTTMQKGLYSVYSFVTGTFTAVHDMATLQQEYKALTEKLENYEYMKRNNVEINKENALLREQLGFAESVQYKNIAAQIIGRDPDSQYSGITIGKGARSGIRKGMPVIAIQNGNIGIVGKIVTVGVGTSLVMPVYDMQCNISARIQNTRDIGIVTGNGTDSETLSLKYIRKRVIDELHRGDVVVTSGENDNYMRDIPIGTIENIAVVDYDTSLNIELKPIVDFARLETVLVVDQHVLNDRIPSGLGGS